MSLLRADPLGGQWEVKAQLFREHLLHPVGRERGPRLFLGYEEREGLHSDNRVLFAAEGNAGRVSVVGVLQEQNLSTNRDYIPLVP